MGGELALLDSSVWISYFRPEGSRELKRAVQEALRRGQVVTCWVVRAEILIGARDEGSFAKLADHMGAVPDVPLDDAIWESAARLGYVMRKKGVTLPLPDLLVAQAAMAHDLILWHVDEHYEAVRRFAPLRTRSFL